MAGPLPHVSAASSETTFAITNGLRCPGNLELSIAATLNAPWTFSGWFKRSELTALNNLLGTTGSAEVRLNADDTITAEALTTTAKFLDPSAWHNVHVSDNGLYINGAFYGAVTTTNLASPLKLLDDFDGCGAEIHLQSGTNAYANFGAEDASGVWRPKSVASGLHHLEFKNNANLGENSGTGGDWTATSFAAANQVTDTPTNNFATLNPLSPAPGKTFALGNLELTGSATEGSVPVTGDCPSGKFYNEWRMGTIAGGNNFIGFSQLSTFDPTVGVGLSLTSAGVQTSTGSLWANSASAAYLAAFSNGHIMKAAVDVDAGKAWWGQIVMLTDLVLSGTSGQTTNFTSTFIPTFKVGDRFFLTDHAIAGNNDEYAITIIFAGGFTAVKQNAPAPDEDGNTAQVGTIDMWGSAGDPVAGTNPGWTFTPGEAQLIAARMTAAGEIVQANLGQDIISYASPGIADENGHGKFKSTPPTGFLALCTANLPDPGANPSPMTDTAQYADGDFIYLGWTPDQSGANSIGTDTSIAWGTDADALANGVKIRAAVTGTGYSFTVKYPFGGSGHSPAPAQGNPE